MVSGRAANRLADVWKSIGVVCEGGVGWSLENAARLCCHSA
jgi:hypothetical protein